ncbi:probable fatty acid-binding protein [Condylostylus longicornis]|uniref:probable fatty acid-binding protein n=1 Tax=Condylostylus longicornis TaxID=2530218 RepID=UPI00244DC548|nr:probable fatty acid-binding protein [Condylostylus longicornis]
MALWQGKKYRLETSENFDDYMKELGIGWLLRTIGNNTSATVELVEEADGSYSFITDSTFRRSVMKFKPGEEFDEETIDGRNVKSVCTFDGPNKFIQEQKGSKPTTIVREFKEDELITTLTIGNVTSIRKYKLVV